MERIISWPELVALELQTEALFGVGAIQMLISNSEPGKVTKLCDKILSVLTEEKPDLANGVATLACLICAIITKVGVEPALEAVEKLERKFKREVEQLLTN